MKFTDPTKITSVMRETHKFTVVRLEDGAERLQDTKPKIDPNRAHLFLVWDNVNKVTV